MSTDDHPQALGSGPAVFASPVADPGLVEAMKALVRDQQVRVAASASPPALPDRGFHKTTIGTGQGELRIGDIPDELRAYLPMHPGAIVRGDVRFSYGSERPKPDDGKGMLGLSLRLSMPDNSVWNLTQLSEAVFLKTAEEVLLTMQAAKAAAAKPGRSEVCRAIAVVTYILRNAPRGRTWAMLKFGWNASLRRHRSVAATSFVNPTSYALDHATSGRSYAVRFELQPTAAAAVGTGSGTSLANDLRARYAQGPVVYDFGARFFTDERETPIDDPSAPWPTAFVKLGTLVVSPAVEADRERIATQPYNPGCVATGIRSLSTINAIRTEVYEASAHLRSERSP